jgi:hypothetical protein
MAVVAVVAFYRGRLRPWMYCWGSTDDEVTEALPCDELVEDGARRSTRGVVIDAPPAEVWPWLAQIGEDRAGFYSYSLLERAVGAKIHNVDVVHPEWQDVNVGDTVWLARRYGKQASMVVAAVEPASHLVLMSPSDFDRVQSGKKAAGAWAFYLRPTDGRTRLLIRGSGGAVGHFVFDVPHFVMEQKMMRGIRSRVERSRQDASAAEFPRKRGAESSPTKTLASSPGSTAIERVESSTGLQS